MTILEQRTHLVAHGDQAEFERRGREQLWPALLSLGARMLAFGRWEFSGDGHSALVTHTAYADFEHWAAARQEGPGDDTSSYARVIDVEEEVSHTGAIRRLQSGPAIEAPPTFGLGSVLSERTYALRDGAEPEFVRLSAQQIWPWLERAGARLVAYGQDPLQPPDEVVTLFAFRSYADWHRLSRPTSELQPPPEVVQAWNHRAGLIRTHQGRLLTVLTDFGAPIEGARR